MLFVQHLLNGLLAGAYYLLIALGLSLIFSLGGIVNLAHGAFYAIGAYLAVSIGQALGFAGALLLSPLIVGVLGVVIERLLFRRFYKSDPALSLLLTFGLAMVAEQALRMVYGAPPLSWSMPEALRGQVFIGDFVYPRYRLLLLMVAMSCVAALWYLLQRTPFGRVVRAGVQNPDMVGALGISLEPYMAAIAFLGIGLAGLAGVMLAPIFTIHPAMGAEIITSAFVVVVIGGLGSFWGVVLAARGGRPDQGRRHRRRLSAVFGSGDLLADAAGAAGAAARTVRRPHPAVRVAMPKTRDLLVAALALVLLPFALSAIGLGVTSATEVVIFALACMALNILVGYIGAHVVRPRCLVRPGRLRGGHGTARPVRWARSSCRWRSAWRWWSRSPRPSAS